MPRIIKKKKKEHLYELTTSKTGFDMPFAIFAKNKAAALKFIKPKLRKGEKIISLKRG